MFSQIAIDIFFRKPEHLLLLSYLEASCIPVQHGISIGIRRLQKFLKKMLDPLVCLRVYYLLDIGRC